MILISGSSEREVVDLQQGDYRGRWISSPSPSRCASRLPRASRRRYRIGIARAIRRRFPPSGRVYLDLPAKLFASDGCGLGKKSLVKVIDAHRANPRARRDSPRARRAEECEKAGSSSWQGPAYAQPMMRYARSVREERCSFLPMSMAGLLPDHASQCAGRGAFDGAQRCRRRDADRRAPELAAVAGKAELG